MQRTSAHVTLTDNENARIAKLFDGIISGNRASLSSAVTLVESKHVRKKHMGQMILTRLLTENRLNDETFRIGLSGPPGAGKSTFIETAGQNIIQDQGKLAVLAVDPSSSRTGGSLLGDKTRMQELCRMPEAFIRPSPAGGELGGVTRNTHEAAVLAEAAGYKNIIIETVGVGQSEIAVANMVDIFILLLPPSAGDELQGIKRGIVELADIVVVNKFDGDLKPAARRVATEYTSALKFMPNKYKCWRPRVRMVSSLHNESIDDLWDLMQEFKYEMVRSGELYTLRQRQRESQMWSQIEHELINSFRNNQLVKNKLIDIQLQLRAKKITPGAAAEAILNSV